MNPKKNRPAPPEANQPPGALSQSVSYFNEYEVRVAVVHRYLNPDGTIGASKKPDPKYVYFNGTIYKAHGEKYEAKLIAAGWIPDHPPELDMLLYPARTKCKNALIWVADKLGWSAK